MTRIPDLLAVAGLCTMGASPLVVAFFGPMAGLVIFCIGGGIALTGGLAGAALTAAGVMGR